MESEKLNNAIQMIKSGNKSTALPLLKEYIFDNPNDANAWSWLYACLNDTEQKKYCLKQILRINPGHEKARIALLKLESDNKFTATELSNGDVVKSEINSVSTTEKMSTKLDNYSVKNKRNNTWLWIVGLGMVLVIILGIFGISYLRSNGINNLAFFATPTPTEIPTPTQVPYRNEMKPVMQELKSWQNDTTNYIYNYAEFLEDYQIILYSLSEIVGIDFIKEVFKSDQQTIDQLIQTTDTLSNKGKNILSTMNLITPPIEISAAHNVIIECAQERVGLYDEISIGLSTFTVIGSEHSFVGPECYSFDAAVEKLSKYVNNE